MGTFLALAAIAVFVAFGYGISALRLMRGHPNRTGVRLAALNLLEPVVTISTMLILGLSFFSPEQLFLMIAAMGLGKNWLMSYEYIRVFLLIAGAPLTVMLLAPLVTRAKSKLHRVVAVYGCLRWINTVVFWGVTIAFLGKPSLGLFVLLGPVGSGLLILIASVIHIGSGLKTAKAESAQ